jgi:site-specific recombinase XerD
MTIRVRNKDGFTTKSKKERVIPISNVVYDLLSRMDKKCNYIFSKNLVKLNDDLVSKSFKNCVKENPTLNQKIHFHTLRHSFASNLAQRGVNLYVIQKLLGHSSITTTQIYSHLRTEDLVQAINELN